MLDEGDDCVDCVDCVDGDDDDDDDGDDDGNLWIIVRSFEPSKNGLITLFLKVIRAPFERKWKQPIYLYILYV